MDKRVRPAAQNVGRILGGGMSPEDFIKLMRSTEFDFETFRAVAADQKEDFVESCEKLGDEAVSYALENEKMGRDVTASNYYFYASCLYRLGDYAIKGITDEKHRVYGKLLSSFKKVRNFHRQKILSQLKYLLKEKRCRVIY